MRSLLLLSLVTGCVDEVDSRERRIVDFLAEDNYAWARRDPALVAMKLRKMQRGPYEWLRGTAGLYWRDATEPGSPRTTTAFGSPEASRVLVVGDPHVENIGTFRASDGTMFVDWNDFDGTGYGPYNVDLRRLATSFAIVCELSAAGDTVLVDEVTGAIADAYTTTIAELAAGTRLGTLGFGAHALLDDELAKAKTRGDRQYAVDELAPIIGSERVLAFGDLEPVADDDVIEDRLVELDVEQRTWIDAAVASWRPGLLDERSARVLLAARRIGSGVASYAAYRFDVILAGPTDAPDDDLIIELKETRDGVIVAGLPRYGAAEWDSPAVRSANTQIRLQGRPDGDALLGPAEVGALSLKVRNREAYQRGIDAPDVADLPREEMIALAGHYGALLAHAHGHAFTADGVPGHEIIAPLVAGRERAFADELVDRARTDAAQIQSDYASMAKRDLARFVLPGAH